MGIEARCSRWAAWLALMTPGAIGLTELVLTDLALAKRFAQC